MNRRPIGVRSRSSLAWKGLFIGLSLIWLEEGIARVKRSTLSDPPKMVVSQDREP